MQCIKRALISLVLCLMPWPVYAAGVLTPAATSGSGPVSTLTIASGVTTNTASTPVAGVSGNKTYWAQVAGTGAVTATVEFKGCQTAATTYCVSLGSIALSGTTQKYDVPTPAVGSANYPYLGMVTTNVTGTSVTVVARG